MYMTKKNQILLQDKTPVFDVCFLSFTVDLLPVGFGGQVNSIKLALCN